VSTTSTASRRRLKLPSFSAQILLGLVLGVLLGWLALSLGTGADEEPNALTTTLATIGSTFVGLLRAIVPPLVFLAIVTSIANLRGIANGARLAAQTLIWFAITALIAVAIGTALGLILEPGSHSGVDAAAAEAPGRTGSWLDFLGGIVPANFLGLEINGGLDRAADGTITGLSAGPSFNILQILVLSLVVGVAALKVGEKADPFLSFSASLLRSARSASSATRSPPTAGPRSASSAPLRSPSTSASRSSCSLCTRCCCAPTACRSSGTSAAPGRRSSSRSSPARRSARCRSRSA
jgi:Na+/H+-dicarboxylate symporter